MPVCTRAPQGSSKGGSLRNGSPDSPQGAQQQQQVVPPKLPTLDPAQMHARAMQLMQEVRARGGPARHPRRHCSSSTTTTRPHPAPPLAALPRAARLPTHLTPQAIAAIAAGVPGGSVSLQRKASAVSSLSGPNDPTAAELEAACVRASAYSEHSAAAYGGGRSSAVAAAEASRTGGEGLTARKLVDGLLHHVHRVRGEGRGRGARTCFMHWGRQRAEAEHDERVTHACAAISLQDLPSPRLARRHAQVTEPQRLHVSAVAAAATSPKPSPFASMAGQPSQPRGYRRTLPPGKMDHATVVAYTVRVCMHACECAQHMPVFTWPWCPACTCSCLPCSSLEGARVLAHLRSLPPPPPPFSSHECRWEARNE